MSRYSAYAQCCGSRATRVAAERLSRRIADVKADSIAAERLYVSPHRIKGMDGTEYTIAVYGMPRFDGTWIGWLEFAAVDGTSVLRTERETTQSTREGLLYWASGLEPVYFQGAFERALTGRD